MQFYAAWLLASTCVSVHAQHESAPIVIDDAHPEDSVPSLEEALSDPLKMSDIVMEISARAEGAEKAGAFAQAARYYRALAKAVPNRATAYLKACHAHDNAGERDSALEMCRVALGKEGITVEDTAFFIRLTLAGTTRLGPADIADLDALLAHLESQLRGDPGGRIAVFDLRCQVAAKLEDLQRLNECSAELGRLAPQDPRTFVYASVFALKNRDWARAEALIADAKSAGLAGSAILLMEQKLEAQRAASDAGSNSGAMWFLLLGSSALAMLLTWLVQRRSARQAA